MGKRRFAATVTSPDHKTAAEKFSNNLTAWIRGWDFGVEVIARPTADGQGDDVFEIWACGGSHARSNGRRYIGMLTKEGFESAIIG